jgi:diguanylate cyclase (GGDEF)-like protein/PAS domain S-box-containing protein
MKDDYSDSDSDYTNSNLLDLIIRSSDDAIASKSLDGIVTSWNPAAEKMFGYAAEEIIGKPMLMIFPDDRLDEEDVILRKIANGEEVRHFRTKRKHKSGRLIDVSVSISPILSKNGQIVGAAKIARDITDEVGREMENKHYRAIVESSDDAIISKDLNGTVKSWNEGAEKVFGYNAKEMIGQPMIKVFPENKLHEETEILSRLKRGEKVDHFRTLRKKKDGMLIHVSATISPIYDDSGEVIGASKIAKDISAQVEVDRLTREFQSIIESSNDAIISQTLDGRVLSWNPAAEQLLGYAASEIIGTPIFAIIPEQMHDAHRDLLRSLHRGFKVTNQRTVYINKNGEEVKVSHNLSPIYDAESSEIIGASQIAHDTTEEEQERAEIWKKANFDSLTGLANRSYFINRATQIIKSANLSGVRTKFYIAFIDVDSFKAFNDNFGHSVGDAVLKEIAMVLSENCRFTDIAGRFAGDEFVLLIKDDFQQLNASTFFERLIEKVNAPVMIQEREFRISISIGVASFPEDASTIEHLLEKADKAMYEAKKAGKNQVRFSF